MDLRKNGRRGAGAFHTREFFRDLKDWKYFAWWGDRVLARDFASLCASRRSGRRTPWRHEFIARQAEPFERPAVWVVSEDRLRLENAMGFYARRILPHIINMAMKNKDA